MESLSFTLPVNLATALGSIAKKRRMSKSSIIREAIEYYLKTVLKKPSRSFLDLASDLCGCIPEAADLSVNKKYFEGFGN